MKLKNIAGAFLAFAGLAFGGVARADVAVGDIYSIDLVENYGGTVPTESSPLRIGQKAVIRVRLLNREFGQANSTWRLALKNEALAGLEDTALAYLSPDLGIMLGGQKAYAKFIEMKDDVTSPANTYTDMYFEYEVKTGDLAMPAQLMNSAEQPAGSEISLDYYLMNTLYWKITNDAGEEALFHFRPQGTLPEPTDPPGEQQNYCVSGIGMGLYVKTIDFDRNYAKEAETPAEEDIWRVFYAGETETTTIPPSIATEGGGMAERDSLMYVWSDDETVIAPRKIDGAEEVTDVIGGTTYKRWVLPVTLAKPKSTVSFALKAATNVVGKTAHIRMSSSKKLIVDDMGVLVTNWVERTVQVTTPPDPYISINFVDPAGNPISAVTASTGYQQYSAAMIVKLNGKAPTRKTTIGIKAYNTAYDPATPAKNVVTDKVIPETSADRRIGISTSADPVDQPWGDRVLSVDFNAGETEKTLYVYALDQTTDIDTKIIFVPNEDAAKLAALVSGTPYVSEYPGAAKTGSLAVTGIAPALVKPTTADDITDAMAGESYAIDVTVADSYRDIHFQTNKWEFWYKTAAMGDTKWHSLKGQNGDFTVDGETGAFTVNVTFTTPGADREMEVYVIDPNGRQSNHVKFHVTVAEAKKAWAELDRADGEYGESRDVTAKAKFFISQPADDSKARYAFLKPLNADASNCVSSAAMTTATNSLGVLIAPGDTDSKTRFADIRLLDGRDPKTAAIFEVVICSTPSFSSEITSYSAGQVYLNVTNVCPRIEGVSIGGIDVTKSGTKVETPIAQNVTKNFRVSIGNTEPSRVDLDGILEEDGTDNRYYTQWKFGNEEWGDGTPTGAVKSLYGNPNTNVLSRAFVSPGEQVIKVRVQDKDMRAQGIWSDEFSFTVTVLDVPSVVITPRYGTSYSETDTGDNLSHFDVELTAAPTFNSSDDRLVVELTVEPRDKSGSYTADGCILSTTNLEFRSGTGTKGSGKSFYLSELDGTSGSAAKGFRITAKVTKESQDKDTEGKTWDPGEVEISVVNVNPKILTPAELIGADGKPLAQVTTVNTKISLAWALQDVAADTNKMSVTWTTSEGQTMKYVQGTGTSTDTVVYTNDVMTGTHTFDFNSSGEKSVTIMVQDKDGGVDSRTLYYSIAASKVLEIVPQGPSTGNGTALSSRYHDKASGLGAGWVDADNIIKFNPQSWVFSGNCGLDTSWRLYAGGYTNGQHDVRDALNFDYTYRPDDGKDSFLYAWLQIVQEKDAAKPTDAYLAVSPEHRKPGAATPATLINLPNEEAKDGGYAKTSAEAIFSKEYLVSDNMGDINQDGIPDIYVKKYEFGVFDAEGNVAVDDLKAITVANETGNVDEDFLPSVGTSAYGSLIPGLKESWVALGKPFDARLEIRGEHDGLNDAPAQAGIGDVAPDRVYAVDGEWNEDGCTISYAECLAWRAYAAATWPSDPGAWTNAANWAKWSPERPTDPCSSDTDDDGFDDGYEYYFWYRAHVGYVENGVLRYLTGRAYDPRNPGEGRFIPAEVVARLMDPRSDLAPVDMPRTDADMQLLQELLAQDAKTRDMDNDGLPDLLEFEIGTNPFDFDTDGDGLPDGFEIMLGGTDPLLAETTKGVSDAMRNFDGDAMAFTTPFFETKYVQPTPLVTDMLYTFALVDADGDTDGVQWYVGKAAPKLEDLQPLETCVTGTSFTVGEKTYVTSGRVPVVDGRLAADLDKTATWEVLTRASLTNSIPALTNLTWTTVLETNEVGEAIALLTNATDYVALMPTRFAAGTEVSGVTNATYATLQFGADVTGVNAAWVYGRSVTMTTTGDSLANLGGFGMLAIGRYQDAPKGVRIAALPAENDSVAYLHHFVYQEFGFDPRTAWNANTPLAARWGKTVGEGDSKETVANNLTTGYGYAGVSTRTREYTLYDEFLVLSFFLNNGKLSPADVTPTQANPWEKIWARYTTNGQGPNEPNWEEDTENGHFKGRTAETNSGENGADTDLDGVPDGWELYVMAGPKVEDKETKELKYNLVAPYNDGFFSAFGPFVGDAAKASTTDNNATGANATAAGDGDGLTELQEYAGTDSCAYYSEAKGEGENAKAFSTTIVRPKEHEQWLNKFFPTDPWNKDTDGDGLGDNEISGKAARFKYGKPVDDGKSTCIPGGGGNPCTVDTDRDGLPDGWEAQFAGQTVYAGEDAQKPKDKDGNEVADGNVLQGYCDGMDGTVFDAYNSPRINNGEEDYTVSLDGVAQVVDRDYDKDGLENWQEYLTGAMRAWRYDDPITVWDYVPDAAFFNPLTGQFDLASAMRHTGIKNVNEFWYRLLFDTKSKWYNPHFVTASTPSSQYFSRVTNGWDQVFSEAGTYYMFYDRRNGDELKTTWGKDYYDVPMAPTKYISTSPIAADTDQDGMDDGYELFHGMNPLLGAAGVLKSSNGPCDIVFDAWYVEPAGSPVNALENPWIEKIPGNGKYDFIAHPWLNGLVDADPDGDDIRNQDEAIMPLVAPQTTWLHTDPTPLWMTDSSYGDSIVSRFFRLPVARGMVPVPDKIFFEGKEYSLVDCDGYTVLPLIGPAIAPFVPDYWSVTGEGAANWAYSFEENEGFDTDHDSGSDFEEKQGKFRNATDPQDADSPRRRQAMYFPGEKAALQSMPFVKEAYPRAAMGYPDDMSFLQYTVECWVRPEAADPSKIYTVLERTSFTDPSHVADERYVRRNFAILIKNGKWCTAFDTNGTLDDSLVEVIGKTDAEVGAWTHVAATYDANRLTLYVNGNEDGYVQSNLKPEYGSSAAVTYPAGSGSVSTNDLVVDGSLEALKGTAHAYWFDSEYQQHAFLIGASFANAPDGDHLDVTKHSGWGRYKEFFKGYVDEVRVWDGAQPADVVFSNFSSRKRFTREDAIENRSGFYKQWVDGRRRYSKDGDGLDHDVMPELRFHWAFDSIPGAENAAAVAQAPHGFLEGDKPIYSRPKGYQVPWWSGIVGAYGSVYAGERNWVPWIPNTVTHLPRLDQTTLDSAYWSENYAGDEAGIYKFARAAEPVSKWTQYVRNETDKSLEFRTTGRRFWLAHNTGTNGTSTLSSQFEFTARHLNQTGDDLLPLGGAFAKYVDEMWDEQGASSMWEQTGLDDDGDGLPNWWQEYVNQNCREGVPEGVDITWDTPIWYEIGGEKIRISAGEAYRRDLAKGVYLDAKGELRLGPTDYAQTAKSDGLIPDWWKELRKIDGEEPLFDLDNDGLNNYIEYVASELLPFRLNLDPRMAKTDTKTLDYFRKVGRLYLGEMLTDHDQMEDHWERSLGDETVASAAIWDALKDREEDGWVNFAENRYNGYSMSVLAQLISHAMGDNEVLDAPIPSIKLKVRYNGDRPLVASSSDGGTGGGEDTTEKSDAAPALVVRAFSKSAATGAYVMNADATWTVTPGVMVAKEVYLGGWEDRTVRGTMAPGNVDIGTLDIKFAQVPQSGLYSWTDESGPHFARPYSEFKEALDRNPDILQNIQNFEWVSLYAPGNEYTSADRAITVTRDAQTQTGYIAVYGERVGTINLTTGDFEFDMAAMNRLRVNYTFDGSKGPAAAWSYKEAIFKITYTAKVPSSQLKVLDVSLAKADKGFVRGGLNAIEAFYDLDGSGTWDPGEPFGVLNDVDVGWAGRELEIELTDMSAVTPRVDLWTDASDRAARVNVGSNGVTRYFSEVVPAVVVTSNGQEVVIRTIEYTNKVEHVTAGAPSVRVTVSRYLLDGQPIGCFALQGGHTVVLERTFDEKSRTFLHEGDFLTGGALDVDWENFAAEVVRGDGVRYSHMEVTNFAYKVTFDWDSPVQVDVHDTNTVTKMLSTLLVRRFEKTRTIPTPCPESSVCSQARPTFSWKIEGEDAWASQFGTTYTAFKVRVRDMDGGLVYDSGIRRLPAKDSYGVYSWTAPLYVGEPVPGTDVVFKNLTDYTWEVAVYNAKFSMDDLVGTYKPGNPFSSRVRFRMNVTDIGQGASSALAVRVCYTGPANELLDRVRVQAFTSPDFTGDPVAETTLRSADIRDSLSPEGTDANAKLIGLPAGSYFLRAYIDTNRNGVRDEWESWGYLNERDLANKPGIFNPVAVAAAVNPSTGNVRKIFIEDCDTDGDWFPDVWEAEQNGGVFEAFKSGKGQGPVTGDAELIGVNTNLDAKLNATAAREVAAVRSVRNALSSPAGVSLMTGIDPADIEVTDGGLEVKSEVDPETLTITGFDIDAANKRVLLKVGAETTANVDAAVARFLNIRVQKGAAVTVKVEHAASPAGPWTLLDGVGGTVTVDRAGADIVVNLTGELPAQGFFRAKVEEK